MKPSTTFTLSRTGGSVPEYVLHERSFYEYGRIDGVRACLQEHLTGLRQRIEALQAILATDDPEHAERLLFDHVNVSVTEVTLRPRNERAAFDALMVKGFREKEQPETD